MRRFVLAMAAFLAVPVCPDSLYNVDYHLRIKTQAPVHNGVCRLKAGQTVTFTVMGIRAAKTDAGGKTAVTKILSEETPADRLRWEYNPLILEKIEAGRKYIRLKAVRVGSTDLVVYGLLKQRLRTGTMRIQVEE